MSCQSIQVELSNKICAHPGCNRQITARGFCVACYYRKLRRGELIAGTQTQRKRHLISNINEEQKTAICAECGIVRITSRENGKWRCAQAIAKRSKLYKKAYRQARKEQLKNFCEICGDIDRLCYDHCHVTNKFRGTLCIRCNSAIGFMKDNYKIAILAAEYLKERNFT